MPWKASIRWSRPALEFPGTTSDIDKINAAIRYIRDHPEEGNRALVDKSEIPELEDEAADVYLSDAGSWYVYTLWREDEIEIILVLPFPKG